MGDERDQGSDVEMTEASSTEQSVNPFGPIPNIIDVPVGEEDVVSINLGSDEAAPEVDEVITLLENENAGAKFWLEVACGYARCNDFENALTVLDQASKRKWFIITITEKQC